MKQVQITPGMQMHRINDLWKATKQDKNPDEFFKKRLGRTYSSLEEELVTGLPLFDQNEQQDLMSRAQSIVASSGFSFPDSRAFDFVIKADPKLGSEITSLGLMNFQHLMQAEFYEKVSSLWEACKKDEFESSYSNTQEVDFMGIRAKCLETYSYGGASSYRPLFYIIMRHISNIHGGEDKKELREKVNSALKGKRILEIGSGPGFFLKFLKDLGAYEVTGLEKNEQLKDGSKKLGVNIVFGDAKDLSALLKEQRYDLVLSKDFLSYAVTKDDARPIMQGVYNSLAPNGLTIHSIDYGKLSEERYLGHIRDNAKLLGGNVERIVQTFHRMDEQQKEILLRKNILNIGPGSLEEIGFYPLAFLRLDCEDHLSISLGKK